MTLYRNLALISIASLFLMSSTSYALPADQTAWGKSSLRIEMRPHPLGFPGGLTPNQTEQLAKQYGVGGRWIGIFGFYDSKISTRNYPGTEAIVKPWISEIHRLGTPVVSIYPLIFSDTAWADHPDWRQQYIVPHPPCKDHDKNTMCFNTGYGDYLIDLCNEAIDKLGIDGVWFDCALWTVYCYPMGVSCNCDSCKHLFKEQTGLDIPTLVNWDDPTFRRWVAWRYDSFAAYIKHLTDGIHAKHPDAVVIINHLHRPGGLPWQTALPLNPFEANIITGSEGTGEGIADLVMRLCRAYGRPQSEVWTSADSAFTGTGADPDTSPATDVAINHVLTCATAGGMPSFGGPHDNKAFKLWKHLSSALDPIHPYINPDSVPYAAMHISQQSETFYFGRERQGMSNIVEPYWKSILGWTQGMMAGHIAPDYVYDKKFDSANLARYSTLMLPMSQAMSSTQCRTLTDYVSNGGTAVLGIGAGMADEWGVRREVNPLEKTFGFTFGSVPTPALNESKAIRLINSGGRTLGTFAGLYAPLDPIDESWDIMYKVECDGKVSPGVVKRRFGKGSVIVVGIDPGAASVPWGQAVVGGDTSIAVTDKAAKSGKRSICFTDGPKAPADFYPDMEIRFPIIRSDTVKGGRWSFSLRTDEGAMPMLEIRGEKPSICTGPSIAVSADGSLNAGGRTVCKLERGEWYKVDILMRLNEPNRTYDISVRDSSGNAYRLSDIEYGNRMMDEIDWIVIVGAGKVKSAFYVDDLRLDWITHGGQTRTQIFDGFETTPIGTIDPDSPFGFLAKDILKSTPAPVEVDGPDFVRMGAFNKGSSETIVHLHNIRGGNIRPVAASPVTIRTKLPVKSASLALSGKPLKVTRSRGWSIIKVPGVALHEVVLLKR